MQQKKIYLLYLFAKRKSFRYQIANGENKRENPYKTQHYLLNLMRGKTFRYQVY